MPNETEKISKDNMRIINIGNKFSVGDLDIIAFPIPHDAACPCGYNIFNSGKKISIATEVGNVYDIHGFDIDFASIYIGKDIYLDEEDKCIKVNKDNSFDTAAKKGVENIDEFVKNAYYILLTRAVYGQMVYIEDDKLRKFLLKIFSKD